jgi:hypothetical protein
MASTGHPIDSQTGKLTALPARSWANYVNLQSAFVDEAKRVINGGGLREPGIAAHLRASRVAAQTPSIPGLAGHPPEV